MNHEIMKTTWHINHENMIIENNLKIGNIDLYRFLNDSMAGNLISTYQL